MTPQNIQALFEEGGMLLHDVHGDNKMI